MGIAVLLINNMIKKITLYVKLFMIHYTSFWRMTEADFYSYLQEYRAKLQMGADLTPVKLEWLKSLRLAGERIFDEWSQNNQLEAADPRRIALAAIEMRRLNSQRNRKLQQILDLPKSVGSINAPPSSTVVDQTI